MIYMRKYISIMGYFYLIAFNAKGQTAEDSIKTAINKLFTAMKNADSKALAQCFTDSAIFQTIAEKDGNVSVQTVPLKEFVNFVNTQKQGDAYGKISFDMVKADGGLAMAWTRYEFYYKGEFNHCGVDSYQLVRISGEWKIQYIIETTRKMNCAE
jgi:hypothetical protein